MNRIVNVIKLHYNKFRIFVLIGVNLWLLIPCLEASSWSKFRATTDNTGLKSEQVYPPLVKQWESEITGGIVASPVVRNGLVYVCSRDGFLRALDSYTGEEKWNFATQGWVDATPYVSTSNVYVNSRDGKVYCLKSCYSENESVDPLWQYDTGGQNTSSLNLDANTLYFGTGYPVRKVIAIDSITGSTIKWQQPIGQFTNSSPAVGEGSLCIGAADGKLYCFESITGNLKWTYQTIGSFGYSTPLINNGRVYFTPGDDDFKMYCLQLSNGNKIWESSNLGSPAPYVATNVSSPGLGVDKNGNRLVITASGSILYALNTSSGNIVWQRSIGNASDYGIVSSPAIINDVIYIGSAGNKSIYAIDLNNGNIIWSYALNEEMVCSPAVANGWVYAGTMSGKFYALQVDTATGKATTITEPDNNDIVKQLVPVRGYVVNPNLVNYKLEYGPGNSPSNWTEIYNASSSVVNDVLAVWDANNLADGNYTLKLAVTDSLPQPRMNLAMSYVTVNNPPSPPTGLVVTDNPNDEGGKLNLVWTKSADDGTGDNDVTNYRIYRSTYNSGFVLKDTVIKNTTYYQDITATKKTTFYYVIHSYDSAQNESGDSNIVNIFSVDNLPPTAPKSLVVIPGDGFVNLAWDPNPEPDIWRYDIYRASGPAGVQLLTSVLHPNTTHQDTGLINGVTYFYQLKAIDDSYLISNYSYPPISVAPYAGADGIPPSVVADLSAIPGANEGEVFLSWSVPGDDGIIGSLNDAYYQIKYSTIVTDTWWTIQYSIIVSTNNQQPGIKNNYSVNGLTAGSTYYFWLRVADNAGNWNELSNKTTSWSQRVSPAQITDLVASAGTGEGTVILTWTSTGDDGNSGTINSGQWKLVYTSDVTKNVDTAEYIVIWTTNTVSGNRQNKLFTGFRESTTYYFWLSLADEVLNWSLNSNRAQSMANGTPPAVVTDLVAIPGNYMGEILLSWTAPGNDGTIGVLNGKFRITCSTMTNDKLQMTDYKIEITTTNCYPSSVINHSISGLNVGVAYYFRLWTADEVPNWSAISNETSTYAQVDLIPPQSPQDLIAIDTPNDWGGVVDLNWTKSADDGSGYNDVTAYWIFRTTNPGSFSAQPVVKLDKGTTYYQDTNLTNKIVYYYLVRAHDGRNLSVPSNSAQVTPLSSWSQVNAESGGTITSPEGLEIVFNPGTLSQNDSIFVKKLTKPDTEFNNQKIPPNTKALDEAWEIKLNNSSTSLQKMAILKIPYNKNEILSKNMKEENLRMYWWDETKNEWRMLNSAEPRPSEGRVVADGVSHFSVYRIMEFIPSGDVITKEETYAYPNPARQTDTVFFKFKLNYNAEVMVEVYTVSGEPVVSLNLPKTDVQAGRVFEIAWDVKNVASGVYIYRVEAKSDNQTKTVVKKLAVVH